MKTLLVSLAVFAFVASATGVSGSDQATPVNQPKTVLVHRGVVLSPKRYRQYYGYLGKFKVPAAPGYVDFSLGQCQRHHIAGCMEWTDDHATVILTPFGHDPGTFAHELGHVFDMYVLATTGYRDRFAALVGHKWTTPHSEEQFADAYMVCALHAKLTRTVTTGYKLRVTPRLHRRVCRLIRSSYAAWLAQEDHPYGQVSLVTTGE